MLSVADDIGVSLVISELLSAVNSDKAHLRRAAVTILRAYCEDTKANYTDLLPQLIRSLLHLLADSNVNVLVAAWECLNAITKVNATTANASDNFVWLLFMCLLFSSLIHFYLNKN